MNWQIPPQQSPLLRQISPYGRQPERYWHVVVGALGDERAHAPEQHEAPEHGTPAIKHEPSDWHRPPLQFPLQQSVFELHTSLSARHAPERTQRMLPPTERQAPEQQFPSLVQSSPIG